MKKFQHLKILKQTKQDKIEKSNKEEKEEIKESDILEDRDDEKDKKEDEEIREENGNDSIFGEKIEEFEKNRESENIEETEKVEGEENGDKKENSKEDFYNKNKEIEEIQNKQIKWAVFLMVGIILIVVLFPFIKNNFIDKFDYKGLVFQKTQLGELIFYSTRFPVVSGTGQVIGDYSINLRNDPRDLEYIPINVTEGRIAFSSDGREYSEVYISLNPFMEVCEDSGIALFTLSGFLADSGLEVKSAVTDKAYARDNNLTQRWCETGHFDTVIVVTEGDQTIINEIQDYCYEIQFKDCEILQATEKFMLIILEEYASRFEN